MLILDAEGDIVRFVARGTWTSGPNSRVFRGQVNEAESVPALLSNGMLDGDGGSGILLPSFGCRVTGVMQVSVQGQSGNCQRASVSLTAEEGFALCAADFDCSGRVDSEDVFSFLRAWEESQADVTGDGTTDGDDIIAFMELWNAGC